MRTATPRVELSELTNVDQALAIVVYIVLRHGDAYAPLLDRPAKEKKEQDRKASYRARAQRILDRIGVTNALVR